MALRAKLYVRAAYPLEAPEPPFGAARGSNSGASATVQIRISVRRRDYGRSYVSVVSYF
jgi:hypothetical protein